MAETISNPPFTGIHNFRDVGKVINSQPSTKEGFRRILKEGVLLRSGRLDEATETDAQLLLKEYRIKTVIDLRTKTEHVKQKEVVSQRQQRAVEWNTVKIHFIGRKFEMNLLRQLRWWQVIWVILLILIRRRIAAIHVMGRNVMSPRGLVGLSQDSLQFCQSEILQALEVYLDPQAYPILVHCTQGKDRSGLVIILILFILRVPVECVKADYILSDPGLDRIRDSMMEEVLEIGMDEKYTRAPGEVVDGIWKFLEDRGGVDVYLDEIGFGESKRQKLRDLLLE